MLGVPSHMLKTKCLKLKFLVMWELKVGVRWIFITQKFSSISLKRVYGIHTLILSVLPWSYHCHTVCTRVLKVFKVFKFSCIFLSSQKLLEKCPTIRKINLTGCIKLNSASISCLVENLPDLASVDLTSMALPVRLAVYFVSAFVSMIMNFQLLLACIYSLLSNQGSS